MISESAHRGRFQSRPRSRRREVVETPEKGEAGAEIMADAQLAGSSRLSQHPLKKLSRIAKRPPVDIEFQDLGYTVRGGGLRAGEEAAAGFGLLRFLVCGRT